MKTIFRFSILLTILFACRRENVDHIGPGFISPPEGFAITSFTASTATVNFTTGTVVFDATFTHSVSWILTIKGEKSGAVKEYRGVADNLTGITWTGAHDEVFFFRNGEKATATLSFYGSTLTESRTVQITTVPNFRTCGVFPLYGEFENPARIKTPWWQIFEDTISNPRDIIDYNMDSVALDRNGDVVPSVQGKTYFYLKGLGKQSSFVNGIQYVTLINPNIGPAVLPADADNVWVNIYLYGSGDPNCMVQLEYQEGDFDGTSAGYSGTDDDAFVAEITLDHKGWKLFSFRYSSLVPSVNALFGGSGNKMHEPDKLKMFDLILLKKSDANSPVEVFFDYPIFTVGGPFKPCK